ncbi:MAG TPA: isocitrate/isopropylmalate family dehydrogenase, partial [Leptospiraceae bacterium]|nr:isocitrate/isopropylmalate family dehydrogenase [Leptospiraceae bacterium]
DLQNFAERLEKAVIDTIESGEMTKDLIPLSTAPAKKQLDTFQFMEAVQKRLDK